jgi:regulator of PEP synthase PpsR (kinase-PPPase family)
VSDGPILYLVSHASGELVEMLARNTVAQLDGVSIDMRLWKMVRDLGQAADILGVIATRRGYVLHSVAGSDVRSALEEGCTHLGVPCRFVLEPFVPDLAAYYGATIRFRASARDVMDEDYFRRVEAMKYALGHDDGVAADDLEKADVILVGVSRATKTPTCLYLASRGIKAANVPLVPGVPLPNGVFAAQAPLVVGLTVNPAHLARVRGARLRMLSAESTTDYAADAAVAMEVRDARRLFARQRWPVIDVTNRPIEQTANRILKLLEEKRQKPR